MSSASESPGSQADERDDAASAPEYPQVPPPPSAALATASQRLHPAALGVWALGGVGPLALLLVAGSLNLIVAGIAVAFAAVGSVARWLRFRWRLESDALVIEQGVIQRQRRVIPLERIQSVEAVRKLGHRVFGVVELRVETIGGGSTEGQLDALDPEVAARLRRELLRRGTAGVTTAARQQEDAAPPLAHMRPRQLVAAGLTGGRVGVFAAIVGFASQALGERTQEAIEWVMAYVGGTGVSDALTTALLLAAGAFAVAFLLSIVATTLTFWDFQLTRDERNLYTSRGLLDQRSGTIPLHRVQSVRVEENALRRLLGLASVKVEVAGHAGGDSGQETSTVLPLGRRREALALAGTILGRSDADDIDLTPMPRGARDRRFVRAAAATVVVAAPLVWWLGGEAAVALGVAVPFGLLASVSYRALGHAESDGLLVARSGVLVRRTYLTLERSLQAVAVASTPFQRRRGLATLVLHIARSPRGGGDPTVIDVSAEHALAELWRLASASDLTARQPVAAGPTVRAERDADSAAIRDLRAGEGGGRAGARYDPQLSLVAEEDGEVIGHAPIAPAALDGDGATGKVELLAPVAVRADREGEGLEKTLVRASLAASAQRGAHRLLASGDRELLEGLGFEPAEAHGLEVPGGNGPWLVRLLPADDGSARGAVVGRGTQGLAP